MKDGWIEWDGADDPPVDPNTLVDVVIRDTGYDYPILGHMAMFWGGFGPTHNHWKHYGDNRDIVAYRPAVRQDR